MGAAAPSRIALKMKRDMVRSLVVQPPRRDINVERSWKSEVITGRRHKKRHDAEEAQKQIRCENVARPP